MDKAEKLLRIFEAYNLCSADFIGRLVREEMLVSLGKQDQINWDVVSSNEKELAEAKRHYDGVRKLEAYKEAFN